MRKLPLIFLPWLSACFLNRPAVNAFDQGEYRIIHGQSYVCIQPNIETPWKEKCRHTKTGQILDVEKRQISTEN